MTERYGTKMLALSVGTGDKKKASRRPGEYL
jgi:hypothetical protein